MLEAARLSRSYLEGIEWEDFLEDKRTQQAVILNLLTLVSCSHIIRNYPDFQKITHLFLGILSAECVIEWRTDTLI